MSILSTGVFGLIIFGLISPGRADLVWRLMCSFFQQIDMNKDCLSHYTVHLVKSPNFLLGIGVFKWPQCYWVCVVVSLVLADQDKCPVHTFWIRFSLVQGDEAPRTATISDDSYWLFRSIVHSKGLTDNDLVAPQSAALYPPWKVNQIWCGIRSTEQNLRSSYFSHGRLQC